MDTTLLKHHYVHFSSILILVDSGTFWELYVPALRINCPHLPFSFRGKSCDGFSVVLVCWFFEFYSSSQYAVI